VSGDTSSEEENNEENHGQQGPAGSGQLDEILAHLSHHPAVAAAVNQACFNN